MNITVILAVIIELVFWVVVVRWYRRKNKPIGTIVISETEDGIIPRVVFEDDDDFEKLLKKKKVVFKVEKTPVDISS